MATCWLLTRLAGGFIRKWLGSCGIESDRLASNYDGVRLVANIWWLLADHWAPSVGKFSQKTSSSASLASNFIGRLQTVTSSLLVDHLWLIADDSLPSADDRVPYFCNWLHQKVAWILWHKILSAGFKLWLITESKSLMAHHWLIADDAWWLITNVSSSVVADRW